LIQEGTILTKVGVFDTRGDEFRHRKGRILTQQRTIWHRKGRFIKGGEGFDKGRGTNFDTGGVRTRRKREHLIEYGVMVANGRETRNLERHETERKIERKVTGKGRKEF
jgi:hypothetical protein